MPQTTRDRGGKGGRIEIMTLWTRCPPSRTYWYRRPKGQPASGSLDRERFEQLADVWGGEGASDVGLRDDPHQLVAVDHR